MNLISLVVSVKYYQNMVSRNVLGLKATDAKNVR